MSVEQVEETVASRASTATWFCGSICSTIAGTMIAISAASWN
jgi:hypothetical protein